MRRSGGRTGEATAGDTGDVTGDAAGADTRDTEDAEDAGGAAEATDDAKAAEGCGRRQGTSTSHLKRKQREVLKKEMRG